MPDEKELIQQQIEYYRARAAEYDQWFNRAFRYDRGEEQKKQWFADVETVRQALKESNPAGDILELACGTGLWTKYLISDANILTAVDVSPEMIEINRGWPASLDAGIENSGHTRDSPKPGTPPRAEAAGGNVMACNLQLSIKSWSGI